VIWQGCQLKLLLLLLFAGGTEANTMIGVSLFVYQAGVPALLPPQPYIVHHQSLSTQEGTKLHHQYAVMAYLSCSL
jgi:hypothetical protein